MQTVVGTGPKSPSAHTLGVRVMLLTTRPDGPTACRLASYGSLLSIADSFEPALAGLLEDPMGYDLFVMDCDAYGGFDAAERAVAALIRAGARMRVMLVSCDFDEPAYPLGRRTAVCLPDGAPEESFRHGFDHVLRDRATVTLM